MTNLTYERTNKMIFAVRLGVKAAKSKTARKLAKKAAKKIAENVEVTVVNRGLDVEVAGRKFRVDRSTLTRGSDESAAIAPVVDRFGDPTW